MKVALVSIDFKNHVGGKSTHMQMLTLGLRSRGDEVFFVCPEKDLITRIKLAFASRFSKKPEGKDFSRQLALRKITSSKLKNIVNKNKGILISAQDPQALLAADKVAEANPKVLTVHGELAEEMRAHGYINDDYEFKAFLNLEKLAYERSDRIICVDSRLKDHVKGLIGNEKKIEVLFNFLDVRAFKKKVGVFNSFKIKEKLKLDQDALIVLVARRLTEKCGVIYAIKAAKEMSSGLDSKKVIFCIIGDGPEFSSLLAYVQENELFDRVKFFGSVPYDKMPEFYSIADAVLIPSISVFGYREATSLSALEAMTCGVPVVATDIGGLREIIRDKYNGLLIPEKSESAIADALSLIFKNSELKNKIKDNAFDYVLESHDLKNAVSKFVQISQQIENKV